MTLAKDPEGQSATEKLLRELLQAKEEGWQEAKEAWQKQEEAWQKQEEAWQALLQKEEAASKALLQKQEEASKKEEAASKALLQKEEAASKALLLAKDEVLESLFEQSKSQRDSVLELKGEIVQAKSRAEAVLANRFILELSAGWHAKEEDAKVGRLSTTKQCESFVRKHLLAENGGLNATCKGILDQLVGECCGFEGTEDEKVVSNALLLMFNKLSRDIHQPNWSGELPEGIYAGGLSRVIGAALGVWIARAQQLGIINFSVTLLDHAYEPACEIRAGNITKVVA